MEDVIAAQLATGQTLDELYEVNKRVITLKPFSEYTIQMFAMLKSARIATSAALTFSPTKIEDLWLGFLPLQVI